MSKAPGALGAEERVWIDTAGEKNGRAKAGDRAGASFYRSVEATVSGMGCPKGREQHLKGFRHQPT